MKTWIAVLATGAAMWAAEKPADRKAAETKNVKQASANRTAVTIPAGAVQTDAATWQYTDAQGRKWTYKKTPWGIVRMDDAQRGPAKADAAGSAADSTKAIEDGDSIRFEKPGPFGVSKWTRKKTELNAAEQAAWDRARAGAAPRKENQE